MEVKEIKSKSILVRSSLPNTDYVINPYIGCGFGCTYCYASFMSRHVKKTIHDWGNYVYPKVNAPKLLKKELRKLKNPRSKAEEEIIIFISSVTDPYQSLEVKYKLTRQCLKILLENNFKGEISILTKSNLVTRDIDIVQNLHNIEVGLTITTTDDSVSRYFEKYAPNASTRLKTLRALNRSGIKTYAFVGPLLPHYVLKRNELDKLLKRIANTGTKELYIEHINLTQYILGRLKKEMKNMDEDIWSKFYKIKNKEYRNELEATIISLIKKHKLKLRLGSTIYHPDL